MGVNVGVTLQNAFRVRGKAHLIQSQCAVIEHLRGGGLVPADLRKQLQGLFRLFFAQHDARLAHQGLGIGGIQTQGRVELALGLAVLAQSKKSRGQVGMQGR